MKKKGVIIILSILLTFCGEWICASAQSFPRTESEILNALSENDGKTVYENVAYVLKNRKIYKLSNRRQYLKRGLEGIVISENLPGADATINFDYNSATICSECYRLIDEFVMPLKGSLSHTVFVVAGHADIRGTSEYNQKLSVRRARAAADYLTRRCEIDPQRMIVTGYGDTKPIAANDTDKGRFLNRRVEFITLKRSPLW